MSKECFPVYSWKSFCCSICWLSLVICRRNPERSQHKIAVRETWNYWSYSSFAWSFRSLGLGDTRFASSDQRRIAWICSRYRSFQHGKQSCQVWSLQVKLSWSVWSMLCSFFFETNALQFMRLQFAKDLDTKFWISPWTVRCLHHCPCRAEDATKGKSRAIAPNGFLSPMSGPPEWLSPVRTVSVGYGKSGTRALFRFQI
jgi:hypothetical protein